ncbi:MAG: phytanoyl-CoA dioxygenase family protein [Sphingomonas sp.]|nr:phytanoyl-CoA dioxygenase family protein [Sphingomonas sp.]
MATDGALLQSGAALHSLAEIEGALADLPSGKPGIRLYGCEALADILSPDGPIGHIAADILGSSACPVRAILFDKGPTSNWALGWHQDRTIAVKARCESPDYGPWSIKAGVHHVEPPFGIIERMITLRVHLDDVPADNAPLLVARGSHRLGRIAERDVAPIVARLGVHCCIARRGDVWLYRTPILHASAASAGTSHRRVLQVDYSVDQLAYGLRWAGI